MPREVSRLTSEDEIESEEEESEASEDDSESKNGNLYDQEDDGRTHLTEDSESSFAEDGVSKFFLITSTFRITNFATSQAPPRSRYLNLSILWFLWGSSLYCNGLQRPGPY